MTYRLDLDRPVADEIRRAIHDQLQSAIAELRTPGGPDAGGIHDVRKSIKKARSAVRLARPLFGAGVARQANAELRDAAASVAGQRDADALVEAIDRLLAATSDHGPGRTAVGQLRQRAREAAARTRSEGSVDASAARGVARQLQLTSDWLARVPARAEGWDAIEGGLRRQYGRGRAAWRRLGLEPTDDERHDWRKRVKDLWYQERLLRQLWPEGLKPYARTASELADLLGDDHDLGLVQALADADGDGDGELGPSDREAATAVIAARRAVLLGEARSLGDLLYADRPDAWVARHRAWWGARSVDRSAGEPASG